MTEHSVRIGAQAACEEPGGLLGARVGLVTNATGVTPDFGRTLDGLLAAGVDVRVAFAPEHGLRGTAQAGLSEGEGTDEATGVPVVDTYGVYGQALDAAIARTGVEVLVFDMQDIGVRYWTYTWTMFDTMVSAARLGLRYVVLDRPNPLAGVRTAGGGVHAGYESFVGRSDVPQRHGLTSGELARLFDGASVPALAGRPVDVEVVPLAGWRRDLEWGDLDLPWVMPSPNLPTPESVRAFAGTGLVEGTNLSEGRGTTRPFELIGAPYVDGRLVDALRERAIPGVAFREVWFSPTFHKHAGTGVRGVQLHVTDPAVFEPVGCGLDLLETVATLYPDDFATLPARDDDPADAGHVPPLDLLWGSDGLRRALGEPRPDLSALPRSGPDVAERYEPGVLLYPSVDATEGGRA